MDPWLVFRLTLILKTSITVLKGIWDSRWGELLFLCSQLLLDEEGNLKKLGSVLTMPKFATTLEIIRDNPDSFYTGQLAEDIVKDVQEKGGIITLEDMKDYKEVVREPLTAKMGDYTWYTNPPPGSGAVLSLILNILKGNPWDVDVLVCSNQPYMLTHATHDSVSFFGT